MSATGQNDRVNNVTVEDINSTTVDAVNRSSEVNKAVLNNPKKWNGKYHQENLILNNSTQGTSFKSTETFGTAIDYNTTPMIFYPTGFAQPVGVSIVERSINGTAAGVLDMYRNAYEYAQNSMITALGNMFYGYGVGNDFDGLGVIIDDGTNTSAYGGLSRATYGAFINAGGSTGLIPATSGIIDLATMDAADDASTVSGDATQTPNRIYAAQNAWSLYASTLTPSVMATYGALGPEFFKGTDGQNQTPAANNSPTLHGGTNAIQYRGKPLIRDQKALAGRMYFINDQYLVFRSLSLIGLNSIGTTTETTIDGAYDNVTLSSFQFRQPMMPVNQLAEVGIFVLYGQLYDRNPNRDEQIFGITTT